MRALTRNLAAVAVTAIGLLAAPVPAHADDRPLGLDVSAGQGNVDWGAVKRNGGSFAYIKATEGAGYVNAFFGQQYNGSYEAGLIRGAYHFALPNLTGGAVQADYFVDHGGGRGAGDHAGERQGADDLAVRRPRDLPR